MARFKPFVILLFFVVSAASVAIVIGGCQSHKERTQSPPPAPAPSEGEHSPEAEHAKECAGRYAKQQRFYQEGSSASATKKNGRWSVRFTTPGHPPEVRGGAFEIQIEMPECRLVRVLVFQ
jgi:hypothetical protein